jgi:very-short-patch-repair endonuclease
MSVLQDEEVEQKFDEKLAAIAAKYHSVITLDDVIAAGGRRQHADARVVAGRWIKVHPGVYRLAGAPWTYEGKVLAAVKAAGDGAVASHQCAARLQGMGFTTALPEISVPRGTRIRLDGVIMHTCRDLDRCDTVHVRQIPVTDPARTTLDLARYIDGTLLRDAIEDGRRLGLYNWHELIVCLVKHARKGRMGVSRLRTAIAAGAVNDGITDTDSELIALSLIREHGLPEPTLQHRIWSDDGRIVADMDFAYLPSRTNFEIDGPVHLRPEVKAKDDERDHELRTVYQWTVRRIWYEIPLYQPRKFIQIVRDTLRDAANGSSGT